MQVTSPTRDGTTVASQLTHEPNSDRVLLKPFPPTSSFVVIVVLSSDLQLDTNFCGSFISAYINNLQTENTQNSASTSKHLFDNRTNAVTDLSSKFLSKLTFRGNPLTAIN